MVEVVVVMMIGRDGGGCDDSSDIVTDDGGGCDNSDNVTNFQFFCAGWQKTE